MMYRLSFNINIQGNITVKTNSGDTFVVGQKIFITTTTATTIIITSTTATTTITTTTIIFTSTTTKTILLTFIRGGRVNERFKQRNTRLKNRYS